MSYYLMGDSGTVVFRPYTGVVESEDASYSNKVTSNPIEGGSTIDDHAVAEPVKVSISGMVTRAGFKKRSKYRPYFIGSISVICKQ